MQHDVRQVYASTLGQWFGASEEEIAPNALPRHFDQLPIFRVAPSGVDAPVVTDGMLRLGQNYPNPASAVTSIPVDGIGDGSGRLVLYDMEGRSIFAEKLSAGQTAVQIDTGALPSGSYIYELSAGGNRLRRKMTVRR